MGAVTIAAVSSPPGPALRGVIRVSGPDARRLIERTFAREEDESGPLRRGVFPGRFHDPRGSQPALLLWMPSPHSYTREDVAELHLPGSPPLLDAALERLVELGARLAGPGEFTRRAFLNGRLDLTRAEGVLELIEATNEGERRAAGLLLEGGLDERVRGLRAELEDLRTLCEASLDFDETETGHVPGDELSARAAAAAAALDEALGWEVRRQPPSALPRVVLRGAPNAGKSSLYNALAGGEGGALVSEHAGTTRDALAALWTLPGGTCLLLDAPGLDPGATGPDATAQGLASRERRSADLLLRVVEAGTAPGEDPRSAVPHRVVWSKADLAPGFAPPAGDVLTSARTGEGLEELGAVVARALGLDGDPDAASEGPSPGLARELFARHRQALVHAASALGRAREMIAEEAPLDLVAERLREATDALDGIAGHTSPEDVLDRIFSRFCIGK